MIFIKNEILRNLFWDFHSICIMVGKVIQRFYKTLTMFQNTWFETKYLLFIPSSLCIHHWCAQNLKSVLIFPKEPMNKNNVACVMTFWYLQFHTLHIDKCLYMTLHFTRHWPCSTICCRIFVLALTFLSSIFWGVFLATVSYLSRC